MTIQNKRINFDYTIHDKIECGMVLTGEQVKLIAAGKFSIVGGWCNIVAGELFFLGTDSIKLLAKKREISALIGKVKEKGFTLAPIEVYRKNGKFKLLIGVVKGKKEYDKRDTDKARSVEDDNRRTIKSQKFAE